MTRLLFIFAFFLFSSFSCSQEEDVKPGEQPAPVSAVQVPKLGSVGEKITFEITFTVRNGCGKFKTIQADKSENTYNIRVYPKYEGEICHQALVDLTTSYTFTPTEKGTYTFSFWQGPDSYLIRTIEVK